MLLNFKISYSNQKCVHKEWKFPVAKRTIVISLLVLKAGYGSDCISSWSSLIFSLFILLSATSSKGNNTKTLCSDSAQPVTTYTKQTWEKVTTVSVYEIVGIVSWLMDQTLLVIKIFCYIQKVQKSRLITKPVAGKVWFHTCTWL